MVGVSWSVGVLLLLLCVGGSAPLGSASPAVLFVAVDETEVVKGGRLRDAAAVATVARRFDSALLNKSIINR